MGRARRAAAELAADPKVNVDATPKVWLEGGDRHGEGFSRKDWDRITKERAAWALQGRGRADWLDYKLTDEIHEIRTTDGKTATVHLYTIARHTPKGSR
jgi:hypothetical protein